MKRAALLLIFLAGCGVGLDSCAPEQNLLVVEEFQCSPPVLPADGGTVSFLFRAHTTGHPTHLRARIWIDDPEPYVFSPAEGADPRSVFFPSATGFIAAPRKPTLLGPKETTILLKEGSSRSLSHPLQINLEILGFDGDGREEGVVKVERCGITLGEVRQSAVGSGTSREAPSRSAT